MTAAYHHTGVFSIKNPTIESEVSWSSLLSFYTLEEQSLQHLDAVAGPSNRREGNKDAVKKILCSVDI